MDENLSLFEKERWKSIFFQSDFRNALCSFCTQFPMCRYLTYKELAIIRLLQLKQSDETRFFTPSEIHSEFLKVYRIEKDGYNKFKDFLITIENETRLITRIAKNSFLETTNAKKKSYIKNKKGTKEKRRRKKSKNSNDYFYALAPFFSFDSIDLHTLSVFCPIGFDNLSYQILELLNRGESLTIKDIIDNLVHFRIFSCERTIRRRIRDLLALGIVFSIKPADVTKPISYVINTGYFYPTKYDFL